MLMYPPGTFRSYFGAVCVPVLDPYGGYGGVTHEWANAASGLGGGLAVNQLRLHVRNMRVDIAKQRLAEMAISNNVDYILFLDDDVIPPGDTLLKMVRLWRSDPKYSVISGIYWSKSDPPHPLIFHGDLTKGELIGSYWNWKTGDLIQCDAGGAGLLFVDTKILKKMSKPWFSCEYYFDDPRGDIENARWGASQKLLEELNKGKAADEAVIKGLREEIEAHRQKLAEIKDDKMDPNLLLNKKSNRLKSRVISVCRPTARPVRVMTGQCHR